MNKSNLEIDYLAVLMRETASENNSNDALPEGRTRRLYCGATNNDELDTLLNCDPFHEYDDWEMQTQIDNSLYVGDASDAEIPYSPTLESRIGTDAIREKPTRYEIHEREPIVRVLRDASGGALDAVITRSSDGFEVLVTTKMMFVNIDFDKDLNIGVEEQEGIVKERASAWALRNDWGIRIYRTHSGHRLMVTNPAFDSVGDLFDGICDAVGASLLFQKLCHVQEYFRARLTPKPARCGMEQPPSSFPFYNTEEEAYFKGWLAAYKEESSEYATCRFEGSVGVDVIDPNLESLIRLHDEATGANSSLPLG